MAITEKDVDFLMKVVFGKTRHGNQRSLFDVVKESLEIKEHYDKKQKKNKKKNKKHKKNKGKSSSLAKFYKDNYKPKYWK